MPRFRTSTPAPAAVQDLAALISDVLRPGNFFTGPGVRLDWQFRAEAETTFEVFRGRLLGPGQTRERRRFDTWDVYVTTPEERSAEPVISAKLDRGLGQLHVTRAIECYGWEPYDAGDNVILSREVRQWVPELVGTVELAQFPDSADLLDELLALLFQAVVGSSRLALTSLEAPLPAFTLGRLGYVYRAPDAGGPLDSPADLLTRGLTAELSWLEKAKLLELLLRKTSAAGVEGVADVLAIRWAALGHDRPQLLALFRTMFNEVALSPYTDFVDNALSLLQACVKRGHLSTEELVDFLSYLLRQLGRHLTAYDLITFHHRGANYPDALVLDAVLKLYLDSLRRHPALFLVPADEARGQVRRRALRQAWLLRRQYEGLPVPDLPVSPGENLRVLPAPFVRVPAEQILDPARRTRRLYDGDPIIDHLNEHAGAVLAASIRDLEHAAELNELGTAVFVDRPLGAFKAPGEPDQTLLFSHEAFSLSVAERRLRSLAEGLGLLAPAGAHETALRRLRDCVPRGVGLKPGPGRGRPGVVSVRDAEKVAADFVFQRTTRQTWRAFLEEFDFPPLRERFSVDFLDPWRRALVLAEDDNRPGALTVYDERLDRRLELQVDSSAGYQRRGGREFPAAGLRVVNLWKRGGTSGEVRAAGLVPAVRPAPPG